MGRIEEVCSFLDKCVSLADVGCDHGYCTQYALERGLCQRAVIADVSAKSLAKAERLLAPYIKSGRVTSVCCDGLQGIPPTTEQVLIAGMGGEEIVGILTRGYIPQKFVLQPMRNCSLVRSFLISSGCAILADDVFFDGKYYFIIKGTREGGTSAYSPVELEFGRHSLKNVVFADYASAELKKKLGYLRGCKQNSDCASLTREIGLLKEALEIYEGKGSI